MIIKNITSYSNKDLDSFNSGVFELDNFLKKYVKDNDLRGYGKTFILEDNNEIVGFFTLCSASIRFEEFPSELSKHLPRYIVPSIRIARLAVSKDKHGKGYGKELLKQAFLRIINISNTIGVKLIIVDAKDTSKSFYEKFGFNRLQTSKLSYYLLLDTLLKAI